MSKKDLTEGSPLIIEDLDVTMKVQIFQGPCYFSFWKRLWKNITCRHDMSGMWFNTQYCRKCGVIK